MNEISTLVIERLTVSGFRHFESEQSWDFGRTTTVTGHNFQGKSTIADAIAFALTGAPYFGGRDPDRLHNPAQRCLKATLTVRTTDNQRHEIARLRLNGKTSLSVDGTKTTQERFAARFGSRDLVLSLLNPLYFAEVLGGEGRKLIEAFLPAVSHEAVLEKLSEHMRGILGGERMSMPETYLRNRRDELKELEKDRLVLDGQLEQTDSTRDQLQKELTEKKALLAHTNAALKPLRQKQQALDFTAIDAEIGRLSQQYDAASDAAAQDARQKIAAALTAVRQKRYQSVNAQRLEEMQTCLGQQYARFTDEQTRLAALQQQGVCPTCLRRIDEGSLPEIQKAFGDRLAQIQSAGVAVRQQRDALAAQQAQQEQQFLDWQSAECARLEQALAAVPAGSAAQQELLKAKIKELSAQRALGGLTAEETKRYQTLYHEQGKLESEVEQIEKMLDSLPKGQKEDLVRIDAEIAAANEKIAAVEAYLSERTALLFAPVQMDRAGLRLYETRKESGEVHDVFKLTYDGRDYVQLSLSERVRCGLEIVHLLGRLSGKSYPLFVDNSESLCDLGTTRPAGQLILARVVSGQPLQVRNMDAPQQKAG